MPKSRKGLTFCILGHAKLLLLSCTVRLFGMPGSAVWSYKESAIWPTHCLLIASGERSHADRLLEIIASAELEFYFFYIISRFLLLRLPAWLSTWSADVEKLSIDRLEFSALKSKVHASSSHIPGMNGVCKNICL